MSLPTSSSTTRLSPDAHAMSRLKRMIFSVHAFIGAVALVSTLWASCDRETATLTALPAPEADDRPPGSPPELPRLRVEMPTGPTNSPTRVLSQGDDLQDALDAAKPGDVLALAPGATFKGPIRLTNKPGS